MNWPNSRPWRIEKKKKPCRYRKQRITADSYLHCWLFLGPKAKAIPLIEKLHLHHKLCSDKVMGNKNFLMWWASGICFILVLVCTFHLDCVLKPWKESKRLEIFIYIRTWEYWYEKEEMLKIKCGAKITANGNESSESLQDADIRHIWKLKQNMTKIKYR